MKELVFLGKTSTPVQTCPVSITEKPEENPMKAHLVCETVRENMISRETGLITRLRPVTHHEQKVQREERI